MQLFTYKKEGISDLELFVDRVKEQGQFFLCDFRSDSMKEWEALGFNWKVSYRFLGEAISLADMTESDLHIYEGEKEISSYESPKPVSISSVVDPTDGGALSNNAAEQGTLYYGTEVTFTATPAEGYAFLKFIINNGNETTENPYTHTMKSNVTIRCLFEKASTEEETE